MSTPKELNFFIEERNWPRGLEWYSRHFDAGAALSAARRRPTTPPTRSTSACPSGCAAVVPDVRARLHRPRPDRADHRPLGPQLRQAAREGRSARDAAAPEHLVRDPQQVLHAAPALPRALRRGADPRPRPARPPRRPDGDAAPAVRVRRRRSRLPAPEVRAGPPLDLPQEAGDPPRHAGAADEPDPLRPPDPAPRLARARRRPAALEADREAHRHRRGARPRGPRGPARGRRPAARADRARRSTTGRFEPARRQRPEEPEQRKRRKGQGGPKRPDKGGGDRRGARHRRCSATRASTASGWCSATRSRSPRRSSSPTSPSPASSASSAC